MKNIRKNLLKSVVLIVLFAPATFADGEMGGGGLAGPADSAQSSKVTVTQTIQGREQSAEPDYLGTIMLVIYEYLGMIR